MWRRVTVTAINNHDGSNHDDNNNKFLFSSLAIQYNNHVTVYMYTLKCAMLR